VFETAETITTWGVSVSVGRVLSATRSVVAVSVSMLLF